VLVDIIVSVWTVGFVQREVVSSKNFDPLLAPASSSVNVNVRRPSSLGDNNGLLNTNAAIGQLRLIVTT